MGIVANGSKQSVFALRRYNQDDKTKKTNFDKNRGSWKTNEWKSTETYQMIDQGMWCMSRRQMLRDKWKQSWETNKKSKRHSRRHDEMIREMNPANEMRRNLGGANEKTKSSMGRHTGIIQPTHLAQTGGNTRNQKHLERQRKSLTTIALKHSHFCKWFEVYFR